MVVKKVAVLFSGSGTNLENLLQKLHKKDFGHFSIEVVLTLCNIPTAKGIEKSRKYGIEPVIVNHKEFSTRESFDAKLVEIIKEHNVDLTILAGFMRFLTPVFTKNIKAINLHPSLLPLFKGAHAIEESFASNMKVGGISVHFVNEELDGGEIIAQECFRKSKDMSLEEFEEKIHKLEYSLLPKTVVEVLGLTKQ